MAGVTPHPTRLPNREAQSHVDRKVLRPAFAWQDSTAEEHAIAFTVAKMMDEDMLAETQKALQDALAQGTDFATFKARLKPYLMARGWWGKQLMGDPQDGEIKLVQLGSTRRLRTIYHTNLHSAYAAGQWARIERNKKAFPYLKYIPSDAAFPREEHRRFYGMILPVDDPFWQTHMPPNGWGCRCNVRALTRAQAEKEGISPSPQLEDVEHINTRTGEVEHYPEGVDPSFAHNPGDRLGALLQLAEEKHGAPFARQLTDKIAWMQRNPRLPLSERWKDVVSIGRELWDKHAALFNAANLDEPGAFAQALVQVMAQEGVRTGAQARAAGDAVARFQNIIERYPASWVEKGNAVGTTYIRNLTSRGFQLYLGDEDTARRFTYAAKHNAKYTPFGHLADEFRQGDSILKLNEMGGRAMSNKAADISIHEYGHRLQAVMPELDDYFRQAWLDRTAGEKNRPLNDILHDLGELPRYGATEIGRKDHFVNPYFGRNYGSDEAPSPMEMLTMTFEALLGSGGDNGAKIKALLNGDRELAHLGIGLLMRLQP